MEIGIAKAREAAVERDDVKEPLSEVSLFKKNRDHLQTDLSEELYNEATRSNPNFNLAYRNGKSLTRVQDFLFPTGAHHWELDAKEHKEIIMNKVATLHYTYSRFSDLTSGHGKCDCKSTKEDLE